MADSSATELDNFRTRAQSWLDANFPAALAGGGAAGRVQPGAERLHFDHEVRGAKIGQDRTELMVEAMGHQDLGWEGDAFDPSELGVARAWLRSKANSIEGGTSEINLNVVSKRVLGLPDPK